MNELEAKKMYLDYHCSIFLMIHDGEYETFKKYHISTIKLDAWRNEYIEKNFDLLEKTNKLKYSDELRSLIKESGRIKYVLKFYNYIANNRQISDYDKLSKLCNDLLLSISDQVIEYKINLISELVTYIENFLYYLEKTKKEKIKYLDSSKNIVKELKNKIEKRKKEMNNVGTRFLPIGTIVMLNGGTKRIMITGYCNIAGDDSNKVYDYSGCLYPEGILSSDQTALFDHNQILQVYHIGLVDEEEKEFMLKLNNLVSQFEGKNVKENNNTNFQANIEKNENAKTPIVETAMKEENRQFELAEINLDEMPLIAPGLPGFENMKNTNLTTSEQKKETQINNQTLKPNYNFEDSNKIINE